MLSESGAYLFKAEENSIEAQEQERDRRCKPAEACMLERRSINPDSLGKPSFGLPPDLCRVGHRKEEREE